jgi:hypothetical protein
MSFRRSVKSLVQRASHPDEVQILAYVDDDDPTGGDYIGQPHVELHVGPRYRYSTIYQCIREILLPHARGDWYMLWNDDAFMQTEYWDEVVMAQPPSILYPRTNHPKTDAEVNPFPIVPRAWVDLVGWANHAANDTWWEYIGKVLEKHVKVDIDIFHDRSDLTGGHDDQTRRDNDYDYEHNDFWHPHVQLEIGFNAGRIYQAHLQAH